MTNVDVGLPIVDSADETEPETTQDRSASRLPLLAVGTGLFALAVLVPLVRLARDRPWDVLWAEDGTTFVQDANTMPLADTLFRSYAGYSHLLPRLLVIPTRYLPVQWIAAYVAVTGAIVGALVALFVYRACGSHVRDTWARLALAGACVLTPVLAFENEATLVNLQWVVTFATFWAIASRQERPYDLASRGFVAFLGAASSPVAGIFAPLALAVAWSRRRRSDFTVAGAYAAGLVVQLGVIMTAPEQAERASSSAADIAELYGVRVLASAAIGETTTVDLWERFGTPFAWVSLALGLAAAVAVLLHVDRVKTRTALVAAACSFPLFAVPVVLRGSSLSALPDDIYSHAGTRYFLTPVLLLVSAAAVVCSTSPRHWLPKALAAQVLAIGLLSFGAGADWRIDGPSWVDGVEAARGACLESSEPSYGIPVAPMGAVASWLPCSRIEE